MLQQASADRVFWGDTHLDGEGGLSEVPQGRPLGGQQVVVPEQAVHAVVDCCLVRVIVCPAERFHGPRAVPDPAGE